MSQKYSVFGETLTLTMGVNYGAGVTIGVGEKTAFGVSLGPGFIISLEVD